MISWPILSQRGPITGPVVAKFAVSVALKQAPSIGLPRAKPAATALAAAAPAPRLLIEGAGSQRNSFGLPAASVLLARTPVRLADRYGRRPPALAAETQRKPSGFSA